MVKIYLTTITDNIATLLCYPNGVKDESFYINIDLKSKKMLNEEFRNDAYAIHAMWKIIHEYELTGVIPSESIAIWS